MRLSSFLAVLLNSAHVEHLYLTRGAAVDSHQTSSVWIVGASLGHSGTTRVRRSPSGVGGGGEGGEKRDDISRDVLIQASVQVGCRQRRTVTGHTEARPRSEIAMIAPAGCGGSVMTARRSPGAYFERHQQRRFDPPRHRALQIPHVSGHPDKVQEFFLARCFLGAVDPSTSKPPKVACRSRHLRLTRVLRSREQVSLGSCFLRAYSILGTTLCTEMPNLPALRIGAVISSTEGIISAAILRQARHEIKMSSDGYRRSS